MASDEPQYGEPRMKKVLDVLIRLAADSRPYERELERAEAALSAVGHFGVVGIGLPEMTFDIPPLTFEVEKPTFDLPQGIFNTPPLEVPTLEQIMEAVAQATRIPKYVFKSGGTYYLRPCEVELPPDEDECKPDAIVEGDR